MRVNTQTKILFKKAKRADTHGANNPCCPSCCLGSSVRSSPTEQVGKSFCLSSDILERRIAFIFLAEIIVLLRYSLRSISWEN